ncbi:NXPE family member 4-like [Styela clava]
MDYSSLVSMEQSVKQTMRLAKDTIQQNPSKFVVVSVLNVGILGYFLYIYTTNFTAAVPKIQHFSSRKITLNSIEKSRKKWNHTYGKWLNYLPDFQTAVIAIDKIPYFPAVNETTSPNNSFITIQKMPYFVGDLLEAVITSKNYWNQTKQYGGDLFQVILYRKPADDILIPCKITDNHNGLYDVTCPLVSEGDFELKAKLRFSSELLYLFMLNHQTKMGVNIYVTSEYMNSSSPAEHSRCAVGFDEPVDNELCNYTNPTNGEPWFCIKPPSRECNPIISQQKIHLKGTDMKKGEIPLNFMKKYYKETNQYGAEISLSGIKFKVLKKIKKKKINFLSKENCYDTFKNTMKQVDPLISGWLQNKNWHSMRCENMPIELEALFKCLEGCDVYFFGDSVIRKWYICFKKHHFKEYLGIKNSWSISRDAISEHYNVSLHYRSHGPPLHSDGPPTARPYISDSLDAISEKEKSVVIISLGAHFFSTSADIFLERILVIKKAIRRLLARSPKSRVFMKGIHTIGGVSARWLFYRMEQILKHEFLNEKDVTILDVWELSVLMNNTNIHPHDDVLFQQIGLFQSYLCR